MGIKLNAEDIGLITFFENLTKASVKDCIINEKKEKITFIVSEGQAGLAIGKGGVNIKTLEGRIKKRIEVLEFSEDPIKFLSNIFRPIKIKNAYISERSDGKKTLHAVVDRENIGMVSVKTKHARELLSKYFKFDEVIFQ